MMPELLNLKLDDIDLVDRARLELDLNEDFLESIKEKGIIQPITVKRASGGRYQLLAGGRRYSAARAIGLLSIPCLVRADSGNLDSKEIEYLENAQRKDLTWQERMVLVRNIYRLIIEKHGEKGSKSSTARFLDKSVGGIHRILDLAETIRKFPKLAECATEDEAVRKARKILEGALVKQLEKKHKQAAVDAGISEEQTIEQLVEQNSPPGEGFKNDPFVRHARLASHHYRIGNAFDEMSEMIADGLNPPIKLVEIDPPYGIDLKTQKKGETTRELDRYEEIPAGEYITWTNNLIELTNEVIPDDCRIIYWFAQEWYQTIVDAFVSVGWNYDPIPCVWSKGSGQTNAPDLYLARSYETFLIATKGEGVPIVERGRINVFDFQPVPHSRKYHPTQKPLDLMDEILKTFGWPGGIILCPFLGSGVTIRAAYRRNMLPFGWELNEENKGKFLAAVEEDIENYKVNVETPDAKDLDIPF